MTEIEAIDTLKTFIAVYQDKKQTIIDDIDKLNKEAEAKSTEVAKVTREYDDLKAVTAEKQGELNESVAVIKRENQRLNEEMSTLIDKQGTLKIENIRLAKENEYFRSYERKARIALDATDVSLQERAKAIGMKEQLRPINKSFLPPVS